MHVCTQSFRVKPSEIGDNEELGPDATASSDSSDLITRKVATRSSKYFILDGAAGVVNITPLLSSNLCQRRFNKLNSGKQSQILLLLKYSKDPSATLSLHLGLKQQGVKRTKMLTKLPR